MYFPRMILTPSEKKRGAVKYYDHEHQKRGVLRKIYNGYMELDAVNRQPLFNFSIARRCRIMALTASGDLAQFRIQLQDSTGEQYFATPVSLSNVLGGYSELPPPAYGSSTAGPTGGFPPTNPTGAIGWTYPIGAPYTYAPLVFEPNIVLASNQSLTINGYPMTDYDSVDYRIDFCIHVWEFPSWRNGPA